MILITAILFSLGCSGKDEGIEPSSEPIDTEDTEQNNDPVYEGPVYGAFLVDHQLADEPGDATTALYGVFVDSEQPYSNNLLCMFYRICAEINVGEVVNLSDADGYDFEQYAPRWIGDDSVGLDVSFGGISMNTGEYVQEYDLEIYNGSGLTYTVGGSYDLQLPSGEQFPSGFEGDVAIISPTNIELTSHDPLAMITGSGFAGGLLADERTIDLSWTPETDSTLLLRVAADNSYITQIEDNGNYTLNFDEWGIVNDTNVTISLNRVVESTLTVDEQIIQVTSMSSQYLYTALTSTEILDNPVDLSDTCDDFFGLPAVSTGLHNFGGLITDDWNNDVNTPCTEYGSVGVDAWARVELNPGETVIADFRVAYGDAVLYLNESCNTADECLDVSDGQAPATEVIKYTNDTANWTSYALGLDLWELDEDEDGVGDTPTSLPDDYLLNVWIGTLSEAPMVDTCSETDSAEPVTTGINYFGGVFGTSFNNDIDTGGVWTEYSSTGPDSLITVTLAEGETLSASLTFEQNDAVIYLLEDCAGTEAAAAADDTVNGEPEVLSYTNESGGEMTLYLGLDMWENSDNPHVANDVYDVSIVIE